MTGLAKSAGAGDRTGDRSRTVLPPPAECLRALDACFRGGGA